jgi:hypothetical protein
MLEYIFLLFMTFSKTQHPFIQKAPGLLIVAPLVMESVELIASGALCQVSFVPLCPFNFWNVMECG